MKRVKTKSIDSTKGKAIRAAINKELANVHYINKVAVDIYGKIYHLTTTQVTALQLVGTKLANSDKQAFEEFRKNVVIYSGRDITHSDHVMHLQYSGFFGESFQKGFFTAYYDLCDAFNKVRKK